MIGAQSPHPWVGVVLNSDRIYLGWGGVVSIGIWLVVGWGILGWFSGWLFVIIFNGIRLIVVFSVKKVTGELWMRNCASLYLSTTKNMKKNPLSLIEMLGPSRMGWFTTLLGVSYLQFSTITMKNWALERVCRLFLILSNKSENFEMTHNCVIFGTFGWQKNYTIMGHACILLNDEFGRKMR